MAFVVSSGQLSTTGAGVAPTFAAQPLRQAAPWEYSEIWRTQPQVRTVIGFLARNIAQLGLHVFRRVSDTDRVRLTDHPAAVLLSSPLPRLTTYRLIERVVADSALYDDAYWIKLDLNGRRRLLPVPPTLIRPKGGNWLAPEEYETASGMTFSLDEVVHIHGYTPNDLTSGTSPLEALRSLLLEESESSRQRAQMWRSGARMTGVLSRPADAPEWSPDQRRRFSAMWGAFAQGGGAEGGTPILEDGMVYTPISISPQQAQYIEARKLTREEVAAAFFIPPPLVGILDHATYSNITEQHKILYQDTLGPWLTMLQQEINTQVIAEMPDSQDVYCEFNIAEKMRGSFEEQAAAASTATGGPWMTRNEQRARMNLPWLPGGDELIVPLNVTEGGLASPRDTAPKARALPLLKGRPAGLGAFERERDLYASRLQSWSARQMDGLLRSVGVKDLAPPELLQVWADGAPGRMAELQALMADRGFRLAQVGAWEVLAVHNEDAQGWSADVMLAWLMAAAGSHAEGHEAAATKALQAAVADPAKDWREQVSAAADLWAGATAVRRAFTASTESRSFGGHDAAKALGLTYKIWRTGGTRPRVSHSALDGDRVQLGDIFGNGLRWPGDGQGRDAETANCNCTLDYEREG